MEIKYPDIKVRLVGVNSHPFTIVGVVERALRKNEVSREEIIKFRNEALAGDYDGVIQTCMRWVTIN